MAEKKTSTRFPYESTEYRRARNRLLQSEIKLRRQIEAVAEQRRKLPLGGVGEGAIKAVRLSELFAPGKRTLFLYNFMFPQAPDMDSPCPTCTSIIDTVDGAARHVTQRVNLAVVAKAPIDRFRQHARNRGWQHALLLSSSGNTFNHDYGAEGENGQQWPLAHVFVRRGKKIHHFWTSELWWAKPEPGQDMRHVDFMWPMWGIFDATPDGRSKSWGPSLSYP
ncbi:MAG: DUF899 domain-containing protein [Chloroflexi bacterium]|nr:MAG: DUF899 domain-containing protein [Chloroflexota bacterium]